MEIKEQELEQSVTLYDVDFFDWTQRTAQLIREGRLHEIDAEHVAEEIEDMGKRDRREIRSRLTVLVMHLLRWQLQPERRQSSSWRATIVEQRMQLTLVLNDSPSLRSVARKERARLYAAAVRSAILETRMEPSSFPLSCPFTVEEILNPDFYPE